MIPRRVRRALSRIGLRLLAFNLLLVFVPAIGVLYLDVYERRLLEAQERSMVQQAVVVAAAIGDTATLDAGYIDRLLIRLERRSDARLRIYDPGRTLIADSARDGRQEISADVPAGAYPRAQRIRDRVLYRIGAWIAKARDAVGSLVSRSRASPAPDLETGLARALDSALGGKYGSATRHTPGQRSVTLFSAVPVRHDGTVVGAVVVSQSTFRILQALYDIRLRIFEIVIASLAAAMVLTTIAAMTVVRPLARLRARASALSDRRGALDAGFPETGRKDELGDLARALDELTRRTNDHVQLVQSFAADVSHELKNPLASIRTAAEMMATCESEADRRRFLELMTKDVARLERLVSGLRDVAVVERQIEREPAEAVSIDDLLRELLERYRSAQEPRVRLTLGGDGRDHIVLGSRERIVQVFDNVIANAISFSPDGGTVEIVVTARDGQCVASVEDRGPGIPEPHLERMFERFFSFRPGQERRDHVGLGLAIARQIVESYDGTITASNRSGGGARVQVSLPVEAMRSAKARG